MHQQSSDKNYEDFVERLFGGEDDEFCAYKKQKILEVFKSALEMKKLADNICSQVLYQDAISIPASMHRWFKALDESTEELSSYFLCAGDFDEDIAEEISYIEDK